MNPSDELKIAFKINFDPYEWMVRCFGLTNAPCTFMQLINHMIKLFIGKFIMVYFGDIFIYRKSINDHAMYLRCVLNVLRREQLLLIF